MSDDRWDPNDPGYPPDDHRRSRDVARVTEPFRRRQARIDERFHNRLASIGAGEADRRPRLVWTIWWLAPLCLVIAAQVMLPWIITRSAETDRQVFGIVAADLLIVSVIVATSGAIRFLSIRTQLRTTYAEIELTRAHMREVEEHKDRLVAIYRENPNLFKGEGR